MKIFSSFVCLMLLSLCANALSAQYVRTAGTSAYAHRTGSGVSARWLVANQFDDNCRVFDLPFGFRFFDRTYNTVNFNINGRLSFSNITATDFSISPLTTPTGLNVRECIHGLSGDLYAQYVASPGVMRAFFEPDRAVFQWTDISFLGDSGYQRVSFQIHLLMNHNIEFHFGGASTASASIDEFVSFVSGLVNFDGTQVALGFGNSSALQTTLPAANAEVTFTPTFTAANGLNLHSRLPHNVPAIVGIQNDVVLNTFRVTPYGTGGTMSQMVFTVPAAIDVTATYRLVIDTAPIGAYNGEATIGSAAQVTTTLTVSGLSEALTATPRDYLLVANVTAITNVASIQTSLAPSNITATGTIWGGYLNSAVSFTTGSSALLTFSNALTSLAPVAAGTTNAVLASFEARVQQGRSNIVINAVDFQFTYNGSVTDSTFANLRLWLDLGARGILDSSDILLNLQTVLAAGLVSFGPFGPITLTTAGTDFLLTGSIAAGFTGLGAVTVDLDSYSSANADDNIGVIGSSVSTAIAGTAAAVYVRNNTTNAFFSWPVQPSDVNLVGLAFTAQTTTGAGSITALTFTNTGGGAISGVTNARLVLDSGSVIGRFDAGDVALVATVTPVGSDLDFTAITGLTLSTTPVNVLMVFDLSGSASSSYQFAITSGATTPATTFSLPTSIAGPDYTVGSGVGNAGIDVTIDTLTSGNASFGGSQTVFLGRFITTARGAGGSLPGPIFSFQNAAGGAGDLAGLDLLVYVEGAGPAGELDATDTLNVFEFSPNSGNLIRNGRAQTGGTLSFLVYVRRDLLLPIDGTGTIQFRGFVNGTNVQVSSGLGTFNSKSLDIHISKQGGGGSDEGGCTASENQGLNFTLLAGVLCTLMFGLRTRKRVA